MPAPLARPARPALSNRPHRPVAPALAALPLVAALAGLAPAQTVNADPDVDVAQAVMALTGTIWGPDEFDGDWTADGRLVFAYADFVGTHPSTKQTYDRLVVAQRDASGAIQLLGVWNTGGWKIDNVSVAVPPHTYGTEALDRAFIAVSAWVGANGSQDMVNGQIVYSKEVRAVRLLSVPFGAVAPKLTQTNPPEAALSFQVSSSVPRPHAEVNVGPWKQSYVVDLAYIDPNGIYGGQLQVSRSLDAGLTLQPALHLTGPLSPFGKNAKHVLAEKSGTFARPSVTFDDSNLATVVAVEHQTHGVVHILRGKPDAPGFGLDFSTSNKDDRIEFAPRVASQEGRVNFTCLTGMPDGYNAFDLVLYTGVFGVAGSFGEISLLHGRALRAGDIEVRGGDAYVAVVGLDETHARRVYWIEASRSLKLGPSAVEVVDDDLQAGAPGDVPVDARSALSPPGAPADRRTPLFGIDVGNDATLRFDP